MASEYITWRTGKFVLRANECKLATSDHNSGIVTERLLRGVVRASVGSREWAAKIQRLSLAISMDSGNGCFLALERQPRLFNREVPRATRLAYFITVHKYPGQVSRLLSRIESDEDFCAISAFNVKTDQERTQWANVASEHASFVSSLHTSPRNIWGCFEQVTENLGAMREFLAGGFDYFVNLSAQCYPLWPPAHVKSVLEKANRSHIELRRYELQTDGELAIPRPRPILSAFAVHGSPMTVHRFADWWLPPVVIDGRRIMLRIPDLRRELPLGMRPCYGSGWFCLQRKHVRKITEFVRSHPEVLEFFRHCGIAIENFFNTVLWHVVDHNEVSSGNLRCESWDRGALNINPFKESDVPFLLSSDALWARKFDEQLEPRPLREIDRVRFGR